MKSKTLYTCEMCNTNYELEEDALLCERLHCDCVEIAEIKIARKHKYPYLVNVKFSDGETRWYSNPKEV